MRQTTLHCCWTSRGVLGLFLCAVFARAQPDVAGILKKVSETYGAASQYEVERIVTISDQSAGRLNSSSTRLQFKAPNKYRLEAYDAFPDLSAADQLQSVFDGSSLWIYNPKANEYRVYENGFPRDSNPEAVDYFIGIGRFRDAERTYEDYKGHIVREDHIAAGGDNAECFVVEMSGLTAGELEIIWIDKKRFYVLREEGPDGTNVLYKGLKLDEPLPDELFQFKPPPDSKQIPPDVPFRH
jgi:outer membrane lipoprotein-sorting protein